MDESTTYMPITDEERKTLKKWAEVNCALCEDEYTINETIRIKYWDGIAHRLPPRITLITGQSIECNNYEPVISTVRRIIATYRQQELLRLAREQSELLRELIGTIHQLTEEVRYMPGGSGAHSAQRHFDELKN